MTDDRFDKLPKGRAGETGNIWYDQLQLTPQEQTRLDVYARALGYELNWRLPLRPIVLEASLPAMDFTSQTPPSRNGHILQYRFPNGAYVGRFTGNVKGMRLDGGLSPSSFLQYDNPLDFVNLKIVRNNTEAFTNAMGNNMFVAASSILGDGRLPYRTDLMLFFVQAETLAIEVEFNLNVERHLGFAMQMHYMILPFGTVARGQ